MTSANTSATTRTHSLEGRTIGPDDIGDDVERPGQSYGYTVLSSPRTSRQEFRGCTIKSAVEDVYHQLGSFRSR